MHIRYRFGGFSYTWILGGLRFYNRSLKFPLIDIKLIKTCGSNEMDKEKEGKDTSLAEDHSNYRGLLDLMQDLENCGFYIADMLQLA